MSQGGVQSQLVASRPEAADETDAPGRGERGVAKRLARLDGVADRHAGVRVAAWVDDDGVEPAGGVLDEVDDLPLEVRLGGDALGAAGARAIAQPEIDVVEGGGPVDHRVARTEQVQVGPVDDEDPGR